MGLLPLLPEEIPAHSDINEIPGQDLVLVPLPQGIKIHIHADIGSRLLPSGIVPGIQPAVKHCPQPVGFLNEIRCAAVTPCQNSLQEDHPGIVPAVADAPVIVSRIDCVVDRRSKPQIIPGMVHGRPLEGCEGLGNEEGSAHCDLAAAVPLLFGHLFIIGGRDFIGQVGDCDAVLLRLRGQPQHEIELDLVPAAAESLPCAVQDLLFGNPLVDDIAQPLRTRLGRKGQTAPADILNPGHQVQGKGIDPEGRHLELDPVLFPMVRNIINDLMDAGIITGAQGTQQNIILACAVQHQIRIFFYSGEIPFPVGTIDHSRLAETTAADTPALQFYRHPVLGHRNERNQGPCRVRSFLFVIQI